VRALLAQDPQAYMEEARREIGQLSLAHHACELVLKGATTVREVMRSIGRVHEIEEPAR
jgi:type II secretory ATPase GspE/PulE/Tfp pilus assembly ATPase PilB-like protein